MRIRIVLITILLGGCCMSSVTYKTAHEATANEVRQVNFAERIITIEFVRALSHAVQEAREKCLTACSETGALELGVGLIGVSQSDIASNTLFNLLGLRLDGAGSEELNCQVITRGARLSHRLEFLKVKQVAEHCQSIFLELRKRELANVLDVQMQQVCRSEVEIESVKDGLLKAIKSKETCEQ